MLAINHVTVSLLLMLIYCIGVRVRSPVSELVVFLVGALMVRGNQSLILSCMRSMSACYRFLGCWGSVFEAWLLVCCIL
jgi:hypothetical protein